VIGSYIQDEAKRENEIFSFSHDFIVSTLDDEVLFLLLDAVRSRRSVTLQIKRRVGEKEGICGETGVPLRILANTENGSRCVAVKKDAALIFRRLETICGVRPAAPALNFYKFREELDEYLSRAWDVDFDIEVPLDNSRRKAEHVQMKLAIDGQKDFRILRRLLSEGRNGRTSIEIPGVYVYRNEVWNAEKMLPFVLSFMGHILSFNCDNKNVERIFREKTAKMAEIYGRGSFAEEGRELS
jgi:hypothetical protein